jgi:hypothetical protein
MRCFRTLFLPENEAGDQLQDKRSAKNQEQNIHQIAPALVKRSASQNDSDQLKEQDKTTTSLPQTNESAGGVLKKNPIDSDR